MRSLELLARPADAVVDVEAGDAEQVERGLADGLGDEDARQDATRSTTQSMQAVSAWTSSGATDGNIAIRSWLRPSLR